MCKEERAALCGAQRQGYTKIAGAIADRAIACPAVVIYYTGNAVHGCGSRQNIGDERFVPTGDGLVHGPVEVGGPVPVQCILSVLSEPAPIYGCPDLVDGISYPRLCGVGS